VRGRRLQAAAGADTDRREPDRVRVRLSALGWQLSAFARGTEEPRGCDGGAEAQSARRERAAAVQPWLGKRGLSFPCRRECKQTNLVPAFARTIDAGAGPVTAAAPAHCL